MTVTSFLMFLLVGGLAGFAASKLIRGYGLGLLGNVLVGIVGAFVGSFLLGLVGVSFAGWIGTFVMATLGALFLLALVGLFTRRRRFA